MSLLDSEFRADRLNVRNLKLNGIDISNFQIETLGDGKYIDSLRGDIQVQITPSMLDANGNYVIQQIPGLGRFARAEVKFVTAFEPVDGKFYNINGIMNGDYKKEFTIFINTTPIITYSMVEGNNMNYTGTVYNDNTSLLNRYIVVTYGIEQGCDWLNINGARLSGSGTYTFYTSSKDLTYFFHSDGSVESSYTIQVYSSLTNYYSSVDTIKSNTLTFNTDKRNFDTITLDIWLEQ